MVAIVGLVFCVLFMSANEAARILAVFPVPSISHQVVFRPLTHELAKRGHQLVIITPDPAFEKGKAPENITEIDVHDISYKIWTEQFISKAKGNKDDALTQVESILDIFNIVFDHQLQDGEVKKLIDDKKQSFDLLLLEACSRAALVFSNLYKVPVIQVSSFGAIPGDYEAIGASSHQILDTGMLKRKNYNLTLWDKIMEVYNFYLLDKLMETHEDAAHEMLQKHFGNVPPIKDLKNNIHMLFLNVNPVYDGVRAVPPSVIYMGGLHQKPEKELPKDLKSYLDSSKNGVIYLSFGTNVNSSLLPPEKIQIMVNVFSQLPYDVLWKWDKDELPGQTQNIRISKWLPQSDLLKHRNIKLFITQGGLQSTDEAITAGVPLIGVPMLGDQWYNVDKYVHNKMGLRLDFLTLTEEEFRNAINTVMGDDSYRRNVVRLRGLMSDQPQRPLERAVWWTEHVLRHGGAPHLRAPAANITWTEYLELQLVLVLLGVLFIVIAISILALYTIYAYCCRFCKLKRD